MSFLLVFFFFCRRGHLNLQFKMGLPILSHPDFTGPACPSQLEKISAHLHPTPSSAPKAPGEPNKEGLELPEGSRVGQPWQQTLHHPQPQGSSPVQGLALNRWQPGVEMQQEQCRRKAGTAASWERPHRPSGFAGGISSRSVSPPHSPSAGSFPSLDGKAGVKYSSWPCTPTLQARAHV